MEKEIKQDSLRDGERPDHLFYPLLANHMRIQYKIILPHSLVQTDSCLLIVYGLPFGVNVKIWLETSNIFIFVQENVSRGCRGHKDRGKNQSCSLFASSSFQLGIGMRDIFKMAIKTKGYDTKSGPKESPLLSQKPKCPLRTKKNLECQ